MPVKKYKPTTPGRRKASVQDTRKLTKNKAEKRLRITKKRSGGRGMRGKLTVRHIGGGAKRFIRIVDFTRDKFDISAKVASIEYDPNRNAHIALLFYKDGEKRYIIAPDKLEVGDELVSSKKRTEIKPGNRMPLSQIPMGLLVYNVELMPEKGGKIVRSAGAWAKLQAIEDGMAQLRLPSTEVRKVPEKCMASIGQVSNPDAMHVRLGKAGRTRHLGIRPTVRGKAMNPVDHPHGGGEGSNPIGLKNPKTPWGKPALGVKTRKKGKYSDKLIVRRRKKRRK
ncbi:50S ribosomal protein L2 [Patescibacteria group bacterium]|nr:50S ribosomal protein L2 [Patescibacteria group bacterium]